MRIPGAFIGCALAMTILAPLSALASPASIQVAQAASMSPSQMQTAVKNALQAAGLTLRQKRQIKPMVDDYQQQTANADAATKKSAQETLLKKIYGVLNPDQQARFKASLKASMAGAQSQ